MLVFLTIVIFFKQQSSFIRQVRHFWNYPLPKLRINRPLLSLIVGKIKENGNSSLPLTSKGDIERNNDSAFCIYRRDGTVRTFACKKCKKRDIIDRYKKLVSFYQEIQYGRSKWYE